MRFIQKNVLKQMMEAKFLKADPDSSAEGAPRYTKFGLFQMALTFSAVMVFAVIDAFQKTEDKLHEKKEEIKEIQKKKATQKTKPEKFRHSKSKQLRKIRQKELAFMSFCLYIFI